MIVGYGRLWLRSRLATWSAVDLPSLARLIAATTIRPAAPDVTSWGPPFRGSRALALSPRGGIGGGAAAAAPPLLLGASSGDHPRQPAPYEARSPVCDSSRRMLHAVSVGKLGLPASQHPGEGC